MSILDVSVLDAAAAVSPARQKVLFPVSGVGLAFSGLTMAGAGMKMLSGGRVWPGGFFAIASIGVGAGSSCQRLRLVPCALDGAPAAMKL